MPNSNVKPRPKTPKASATTSKKSVSRAPLTKTQVSPAKKIAKGQRLTAFMELSTLIQPKSIVVAMAIRAQLEDDQNWPPNNFNKPMTAYYDSPNFPRFLGRLQNRLSNATPVLTFTFDQAFADANIGKTVGPFTNAVDQNTI